MTATTTTTTHRTDARAHAHPAWWAFLVHRLSGLGLAIFLPLHFWALGQALHGAAALDGFLRFADHGLFKVAEWGLVVLLSLHMMGGVRLLLIEFGPASGLRKNWIAGAAGFAVAAGLAFALALLA
ncbi:MAG: succinate dehydrogenase, cytochrome b556 subunit [Gammaproteobacteria bacterium]|nr:succinate dehydrogenase, cytochrome b556 subunit [Gammaproteobacteria bacterium]MBU1443450.1 succinate dehydrogenase, cytochrome b556 subunit [Gammaproteobacteria bacterium]MBU2285410.1 succinate dehydrogenase, cytochrome b556 subunit [Gammaproteobacteria bacterium]MBU2409657.1 succinate dehydrogenase, cytochrome b556 subunit [Gammaproteobacteria bacterium]